MTVTTSMAPRLDPEADVFQRALAEERLRNARRLNLARLVAITAFIVLSVVFRHTRYPVGPSLALFTCYWILAPGLLAAGRRSDRAARLGVLAIPFIDMPMAFLLLLSNVRGLQQAGYPGDAAALAAQAPIYYTLFIFLASLSLESTQVYVAAVVACVFEIASSPQRRCLCAAGRPPFRPGCRWRSPPRRRRDAYARPLEAALLAISTSAPMVFAATSLLLVLQALLEAARG
ncbi:MAG TPA: hypothetical protein VJ829_11790, partial [Candidatus Binatia bacterium]|nr:hypothetical protein [Candidatus Binatia bacterium]